MDKNYSAKNFLISAPSSSLFPMDAINKSNHYSFAIKSNLPHFAYMQTVVCYVQRSKRLQCCWHCFSKICKYSTAICIWASLLNQLSILAGHCALGLCCVCKNNVKLNSSVHTFVCLRVHYCVCVCSERHWNREKAVLFFLGYAVSNPEKKNQATNNTHESKQS